MYKEGAFVLVKPNTKLIDGTVVTDWGGEILEVYPEENTCLIQFDAQTIDSLSDSYILSAIESGEELMEYVFKMDELIIHPRRNTDEEQMRAIDNLVERELELSDDPYWKASKEREALVLSFEQSDYISNLTSYQQENAEYVAESFLEMMHNYVGASMNEWRASHVREICLEIIPRKVSDHDEFFENYGTTLQAFLSFLGGTDRISNADNLIEYVEKIKGKIVTGAKNPNNWGFAKQLMMGAVEEGVDVSDEHALNAFIMKRNLQIQQQDDWKTPRPTKEDLFKGIGRNQKITVQYEDGTVVNDIKYKKVRNDLREGKCEIIK